MGIFSRNTLKDWFGLKKKPTAEQFGNLVDSFLHKTEDILNVSDISGLSDALNSKAPQQDLNIANQAIGSISGLQTQNRNNLVAAINEVLANAGNNQEATTYNRNSPATRQLGGINIGDELSGQALDVILEKMLAPYTAPTLSNTALTSQSAYNAQNAVKSVTFRWVKNVGTPDFVSAQMQYRRTGESIWNDLNTTVSHVNGTTEDASASVTVNTSAVNNAGVEFRCLWNDASQQQITPTVISGFAAYQAPSASLSVATNPSLINGKLIRSLGTTYSAVVSGTISRNSTLINLSEYKIERDYNDNAWADVVAYRSIASAGGTLASNGGNITDSTQPNGKNTVRYRASVKDDQAPTGQAVNSISQFNIYQPVFFGMSSASTITGVDFSSLSMVPDGTGSGQRNYTNSSSDKTINGLVFTATANRFCIAWDNAYGSLATFFDSGTNLNLKDNFTIGTKDVTFADGTVKTYSVALYNAVVGSGTYTINVN